MRTATRSLNLMMNSYRPNKFNSTRRLLAATVLVITLLGIDLLSGGVIRHGARAGASALWKWSSRVGDAIARSGFLSSRRALESQNRALMEEVARAQERAAGYDAQKAENDELRALVNLVPESHGITAPVVSSVRSSPYGTFLIGAGSRDAIMRGALVLTQGGFVVGSVTDVGARVSVVSEVFAPGVSVGAQVAGASVALLGVGGGNARSSVPRAIRVATGDTVVVPQFGQRPVGIVGSVSSSTSSASQEVFVRLPVNLAALGFVFIVQDQ